MSPSSSAANGGTHRPAAEWAGHAASRLCTATRKPADRPTEFVPDLLKVLRTRELSITQLTEALEQDFPHRVRRWADALAEQGLLRHRLVRGSRNSPVGVYTLAKAWGGEVDR